MDNRNRETVLTVPIIQEIIHLQGYEVK